LAPLFAITVLCGVGFGLFQVPNNRNLFRSAPLERTGAAGGMQATTRLARQTAGGVGMSLLFNLASVDWAPRIALGIGAILTLVAGLVSRASATSK
jgi:MFS transporter, DHA2 family, multidrug resistance protein